MYMAEVTILFMSVGIGQNDSFSSVDDNVRVSQSGENAREELIHSVSKVFAVILLDIFYNLVQNKFQRRKIE